MRDELIADAENLRGEIQRKEFLDLCEQKKSTILTILNERYGPDSGSPHPKSENRTFISPSEIDVRNCDGERSFHNDEHAKFIAGSTTDTLAHLYFLNYFKDGVSTGEVMAQLEEAYLKGTLTGEEAEKFEFTKSIEVVAYGHDLVQNFNLMVGKDAHEEIGKVRVMETEANENETILQLLTILVGSKDLPDLLEAVNVQVGQFNLTYIELITALRATIPTSNISNGSQRLGGGRVDLDVVQRDLMLLFRGIPKESTSLSWKDRRIYEAAFAVATSDLRELSGGPSAEEFMDSSHNLMREIKIGLQEYVDENAAKLDNPEVQVEYAHMLREIVPWYGTQEYFIWRQLAHFNETLTGLHSVVDYPEFFKYMHEKYSTDNFTRNANAAEIFYSDLKKNFVRFIYQVYRERYDAWKDAPGRAITLDYVFLNQIERLFDVAERAELSHWYDVEKGRFDDKHKAVYIGSMLRSVGFDVPDEFVEDELVVTVKKINSPVPASA